MACSGQKGLSVGIEVLLLANFCGNVKIYNSIEHYCYPIEGPTWQIDKVGPENLIPFLNVEIKKISVINPG